MSKVLVGVDASQGSVEALRRAAEVARWRDYTLEVVYAYPPNEELSAFPVPPPQHDRAGELKKANETLGTWLDQLDLDLSDLEVRWHVVANRKPARALIERSAEAELVVVGSRGIGGFRGLLLGSTSEQVVHHAMCSVLVARRSTQVPEESA